MIDSIVIETNRRAMQRMADNSKINKNYVMIDKNMCDG